MMGPGMMNGYGFGTFGWIGMILNFVITIGLVVGVVLLVVWLVRRVSANDQKSLSSFEQSSSQPTPREILQIRYARGEISRDEYQQMLADIG
ncbi:MAG TPA: SHOCT domain-containing protein [Anaerolineales bacterium]|nr:SHOCT domain-containing protein [Anaerolineales bacterium]